MRSRYRGVDNFFVELQESAFVTMSVPSRLGGLFEVFDRVSQFRIRLKDYQLTVSAKISRSGQGKNSITQAHV
jgi:hypothetical protein